MQQFRWWKVEFAGRQEQEMGKIKDMMPKGGKNFILGEKELNMKLW